MLDVALSTGTLPHTCAADILVVRILPVASTSVGEKVYCGDGDYLNFRRFESEGESQQIIDAAIGIHNNLPRASLSHLRSLFLFSLHSPSFSFSFLLPA
jgi:hypothetical protein